MRTTTNYRKIYTDHWGSIPKGFIIHHIDGDCHNNNPINLLALSHEDHDVEHISMGDSRSDGSWAGWSKAGNLASQARYARGDTKSSLRGEDRTEAQKLKDKSARVGADRTEDQKARDERIRGVSNGRVGDKHPLWGKTPYNKGIIASPDIRSKMSDSAKERPSKTCPHCGMTMTTNYSRYHGDNCKHKE
jgi:hypothetical protein